VKPFDVDAYADSLLRLIQDDPLRSQMGKRAHDSSQRFLIEDVAQKWKDLFDEITTKDEL
jgi:glycosyltransferase involved in cell wall biosynthesis